MPSSTSRSVGSPCRTVPSDSLIPTNSVSGGTGAVVAPDGVAPAEGGETTVSSSLSWWIVASPHQLVIFIKVVGCGTLPSMPICWRAGQPG